MLISRKFVEQLFKTSTIQRWTDHVRPFDLTALGKHAHMVTIAWVVGRRSETEANDLWHIDWDYLIRGSLYEVLRVSVLTDIKSPVLDQIRSDTERWTKVNDAVAKKLREALPAMPDWFFKDMDDYFADKHSSPERWNSYWVLRAASALATAWEFRLVEHANPFLDDLTETKKSVEAGVRKYQYIPAVLDIYENRNDLGRFCDLCGRLRFQLRWSQTPILPLRPVLDHELIVAFLAYGCITDSETELGSKDMWKRYHAFFGAMFHDLPEVLTRDIISPVKGIEGGIIGDIVSVIEEEWFTKTFEPILPKRLYYELRFFALEEFQQKKWPPDNWPTYLQSLDEGRVDTDHPGPVIESCDKFAAFMEAFFSFSFGIKSKNLHSALRPNKQGLKKRSELNKNVPAFRALYKEYTQLLREQDYV